MGSSHVAGWSSDSPTPAQLKELFAQIEKGRITKRRMQEFLRGDKDGVSIGQAREILGAKNVFADTEWLKYYSSQIDQRNRFPGIPWSEEELRNPGLTQEHFLFLGLEALGGKPLNLLTWHELFPGPKYPKFYNNWYFDHSFAQKTCRFRWYLMPVEAMVGSTNLAYDKQVGLLPECYEVPNAIERATANVLYYLLNGRYLDTNFWSRTCDQSDGGNRIFVFGWSGCGFSVACCHDDADSDIGVAASLKLPG